MIEANEILLENIMTSFDFGGSENKNSTSKGN